MQGHIPENISYIYPEDHKETIRTGWSSGGNKLIVEREVIPTFPATGDKNKETGRSWARRFGARYNRSVADRPIIETERKNTPISITMCGLEHRREGGRAYKVVTDDGHFFDLREDVLLEAMLSQGVRKGGKLGGKYVWAVIGSQRKLVRHKSELYKDLLEASKRRKLVTLKVGDLTPGYIYEKKDGTRVAFIDHIRVNGKKRTLWFETYNSKTDAELQTKFNANKNSFSYYKTRTSFTVVRKTGKLQRIPRDIVDTLGNKGLDIINETIEESSWAFRDGEWVYLYKNNVRSYYANRPDRLRDRLKDLRDRWLIHALSSKKPDMPALVALDQIK